MTVTAVTTDSFLRSLVCADFIPLKDPSAVDVLLLALSSKTENPFQEENTCLQPLLWGPGAGLPQRLLGDEATPPLPSVPTMALKVSLLPLPYTGAS